MYDVIYVLLLLLLCPFSFALTSRDGQTGAAETETDGTADGWWQGTDKKDLGTKGKGAPELGCNYVQSIDWRAEHVPLPPLTPHTQPPFASCLVKQFWRKLG